MRCGSPFKDACPCGKSGCVVEITRFISGVAAGVMGCTPCGYGVLQLYVDGKWSEWYLVGKEAKS